MESNKVFQDRVADAMGFFSHLFGGGTQFRGYGNYRFKGKNIAEPVGIIETSTTRNEWKRWDLVIRNWIIKKKRKWDQDSLVLRINNRMYFI